MEVDFDLDTLSCRYPHYSHTLHSHSLCPHYLVPFPLKNGIVAVPAVVLVGHSLHIRPVQKEKLGRYFGGIALWTHLVVLGEEVEGCSFGASRRRFETIGNEAIVEVGGVDFAGSLGSCNGLVDL
jgi:hypothetical protein